MKKLNCGRSIKGVSTDVEYDNGEICILQSSTGSGWTDYIVITPKQLETLYKSAKKQGLIKEGV